MSQNLGQDEVTIFHDAVDNAPNDQQMSAQDQQEQLQQQWQEAQLGSLTPTDGAEIAAAAVVMETVNPQQNQQAQYTPQTSAQQQTPAADGQLTVDSITLRPSSALLVLRLAGLGLVLLLFLVLVGIFFDFLSAIFGGPISTALSNRYFLLLLGVVIYMIAGFIIYEQWSNMAYTITRSTIIIEKGWLFRNKRQLKMSQFGGAMVDQGVMGKLLKYGSIRLMFSGAVGKLAGESINDISDPFENYQMMEDLIRDASGGGGE